MADNPIIPNAPSLPTLADPAPAASAAPAPAVRAPAVRAPAAPAPAAPAAAGQPDIIFQVLHQPEQYATDLQRRDQAYKDAMTDRARQYQIDVTPDEAAMIRSAVANSANPEDEVYKSAAAALITREIKGLSMADARKNIDLYASAFTDVHKQPPKEWYKSIYEAVASGHLGEKRNRLGYELQQAERDGDAERIAAVNKAIDGLDAYRSTLQDTYAKRNPVVKALQAFGGSAEFTLKTMGATVGGAALLGPMGGMASGFAMGVYETSGNEYIDMRRRGESREMAGAMSLVSGAVQSVIENLPFGAAFGLGARAAGRAGSRLLGQSAVRDMSQKLVAKLGQDPKMKALAAKGVEYLADNVFEGVEEVLQGMASEATYQLASVLPGGDKVQTKNVLDGWKDNFMGGFLSSFVFGVPNVALDLHGAKKARALKDAAQVVTAAQAAKSFDEFKASVTSPDMQGNTITGKADDAALKTIYDNQQGLVKQRALSREQAARAAQSPEYLHAALPTEEAPAAMRRENDRVVMDFASPDTDQQDGTTASSAALLDPQTGQRFGGLDYRYADDGAAIRVDRVDLSPAITDRDATIGDMIKELAYNNPGLKIEWNPSTAEEQQVKDRLVAENPRGADWELQFYQPGDTFGITPETTQDIDLIARAGGLDRQAAADTWRAWDAAFRNFRLDTHEMIGRMGLTREDDLRARAEAEPASLEARIAAGIDQGRTAAQRQGQRILGATTIIKQAEGAEPAQILSGPEALKEAASRLRAVTTITKDANPSTLHHEWLHFMAEVVIPNNAQYRGMLEDAYGKRLEDFSAADHENLARQYETYLRNGEAPTPGLKALFKRIADALRAFVHSDALRPELRAFFDRMLAGPDAALLDDTQAAGSQSAGAASGEAAAPRIATDNAAQRAFAAMPPAQRIQASPLYATPEKAGQETDAKILYQVSREDLNAQALNYASPAAWRLADEESGEFSLDDFSLAAVKAELSDAELDAWYAEVWNEARVVDREAHQYDEPGIQANPEAVAPVSDEAEPDWFNDLPELAAAERAQTQERAAEEEELPDWVTEDLSATMPEGDEDVSGYDEEAGQPAAGDEQGGQNPDVMPSAGDSTERDQSGTIPGRQPDNGSAGSAQDFGRGEGADNSGTQDTVETTAPAAAAPSGETLTTSEIDRRWLAKLPGILDTYLQVVGQIISGEPANREVETQEEADQRDRDIQAGEVIAREFDQYITRTARGMAGRLHRELSDEQRKSILTRMRRSPTLYRRIYATIAADPEFLGYAQNEQRDAGVTGRAQAAYDEVPPERQTAYQRARAYERVIDADVRRRMIRGTYTTEEAEALFAHDKDQIQELKNEIEAAKAETQKAQGEAAEQQNEAEFNRRGWSKTKQELKATAQEVKDLERRLKEVIESRAGQHERMKAQRAKAEADLRAQLQKKREAMTALRRRRDELIEEAKQTGRDRLAAYKARIAEKEAALKQREEERAAVAKYLAENKRITDWIMSSNRISLNIWARQRELLIGIQNALFHTSRRQKDANELDAQIRKTEKEIRDEERAKKALDETDTEGRALIDERIKQYQTEIENLKALREQMGIWTPEVEGIQVGQGSDGEDTTDTGTIIYEGRQMSVEEFRKQVYENNIRFGFMDAKLRKALRRSRQSLEQKRRSTAGILAKSLNQEELAAIATVMGQLELEGKANWERREFARRDEQEQLMLAGDGALQDLIDDKKKTRPIKRYIRAMRELNIQERKRLLAKGNKAWENLWLTYDDKRFVQWLDGNQKGFFYDLVIRRHIEAANQRDRAMQERYASLDALLGNTEEEREKRRQELGAKNIVIKGIGPREVAWTQEADLSWSLSRKQAAREAATDMTFSKADLMAMSIMLQNPYSRAHILYGNLLSDAERDMYEPTLTEKGKELSAEDKQANKEKLIEIEAEGAEKEKKILAAIAQNLTADEMRIVHAIQDNFDAHFPETRQVYEEMFNQIVEPQNNYLPLIITQTGSRNAEAEKAQEIEALTTGTTQIRVSPDQGMMLARVDIGPTHQQSVETDIFKIFYKGVEREEHFAKFAPYIRDLNTVLRGRNNQSKALMSKMRNIYGDWAVKRLMNHINLEGLSPSARTQQTMDHAGSLGRFLAGRASEAYIAFNIPSALLQFPNSIAPFFGKADARFIFQALGQLIGPGSTLVQDVYAKSPRVKARIINAADDYAKWIAGQQRDGKLQKFHDKMIQAGMFGQRVADRTMVCAGWWACYQTKLKQLDADPKAKDMTPQQIEQAAIVYADEITSETQPDMHDLELSPMFKDKGLGSLFLQFAQPLNVLWQNLTYDSFVTKSKTWGSTVTRLAALGFAALLVAALKGAVWKPGDGDDNDKEKVLRRVFYYFIFSSYMDSLPLISEIASGSVERLVTGEGDRFKKGTPFEFAQRVFNLPGDISQGDLLKGLNDASRALGMATGIPIAKIVQFITRARNGGTWDEWDKAILAFFTPWHFDDDKKRSK